MPDTEWTINDGWILMSAFLAGGDSGASLQMLVGTADVLNHAIPTRGELSRALTRLARIGVISNKDGLFVIAPEWVTEIEKARGGKGGLFSLPEKGKKWLARNKFPMIETSITISDDELTEAVALYRKMLQQ